MDATDLEAARRLLAGARWLAEAPPALGEALLAEGALVRLRAGQWAQAEGEAATGLLIVVEGGLQLLCEIGPDREVLIGHVGAGAALGQSVRFGGGPRLATMICAEPSLLLKVSDAALDRIAQRLPQVWRVIVGLLYRQLRNALQIAAEAAGLPPRQRLAARLARSGPAIRLSQQALGETVGLTRKTVNGYLGQFERRGLLRLGYGRIEVLDPEGLARIAAA